MLVGVSAAPRRFEIQSVEELSTHIFPLFGIQLLSHCFLGYGLVTVCV